MKSQPLVSIIIILFNNAQLVPKLFKTIGEQTYRHIEVIFVNNGSKDESLKITRKLQSQLNIKSQIIDLETNTGFAHANNVAVNHAEGDLILFMNSDIELEPVVTHELVKTYQSQKNRQKIAGIAPKMYLASYLPEKVFDSFGICVDPNCSPYNRGIGQNDFGQYNVVEQIMGCCFGCALINKNIFQKLGGLDSTYFAYFEDVDWCIRARKSGYNFYSCPKAVVYHQHSASSAKNSYAWKYHLIFRNYLRTVTKSLGKKTSLRIAYIKLKDLIKTIFKTDTDPKIRKAIIKVVINYMFIDSWKYVLKRNYAQHYYDLNYTDAHVFSFSNHEPAHFFDPVKYIQINRQQMHDYVINRLLSKKLINKNQLSSLNKFSKSIFCVSRSKWILNLNKILSK